MIKKVSVGLALSATLLFGGVFNTSADASANGNQAKAQTFKVYYSIDSNLKDFSWNKFDDFFNKFQTKKWNKIEWKNDQPKEEEQKVEEPKEVQKEQPKVEQPKEEQPVQQDPVEPQAPKQEQPAQQAPVEPQAPKQEEQQSQNQSQLSQFEREVVELTNNERTKNGLTPFQIDEELSKVAREKSRDMSVKNYFDHNSPTYGSPFDMMKAYGISYRAAGENIAKGQRTPQEVVNGWMNSPGHRANILNGSFTHIGVGFVEQGNHWTQMFIGK